MNNDKGFNLVEIRVGAITYKIRTLESDSYVWNISKTIDSYLDKINRDNKSIKGPDAVALALINAIDYSCRQKDALNTMQKQRIERENFIRALEEQNVLLERAVKEANENMERSKRDADNAKSTLSEMNDIFNCERRENEALEKQIHDLEQELAKEKEKSEKLEAQLRIAKIQEVKTKKHVDAKVELSSNSDFAGNGAKYPLKGKNFSPHYAAAKPFSEKTFDDFPPPSSDMAQRPGRFTMSNRRSRKDLNQELEKDMDYFTIPDVEGK